MLTQPFIDGQKWSTTALIIDKIQVIYEAEMPNPVFVKPVFLQPAEEYSLVALIFMSLD